MIYLETFIFPDENMEYRFILDEKRSCYDSFYPFMILSKNRFERIDFEPITILYGGNGSGKSTALNVIAEKLCINRDSVFNKSNFYSDYVNLCDMYIDAEIPENSLSPKRQIELIKYIEDCARFLNCQFIISTHSPFMLGMKGAKIYDLDDDPVDVKKWTELENVRTYYEFFKEREDEF